VIIESSPSLIPGILLIPLKRNEAELDVAAHISHPSYEEVDAGRSGVQDQPRHY
jgi:hypothetical protein